MEEPAFHLPYGKERKNIWVPRGYAPLRSSGMTSLEVSGSIRVLPRKSEEMNLVFRVLLRFQLGIQPDHPAHGFDLALPGLVAIPGHGDGVIAFRQVYG